MGQLMVSGYTQIDGRSPLIDQLASPANSGALDVSQIQSFTSKISHICQEICGIKKRRKPKSILKTSNYTNTIMDEGDRTDPNYTQELESNNSAKEGSSGGDDSGDT